jgi:hypothetical protein
MAPAAAAPNPAGSCQPRSVRTGLELFATDMVGTFLNWVVGAGRGSCAAAASTG